PEFAARFSRGRARATNGWAAGFRAESRGDRAIGGDPARAGCNSRSDSTRNLGARGRGILRAAGAANASGFVSQDAAARGTQTRGSGGAELSRGKVGYALRAGRATRRAAIA